MLTMTANHGTRHSHRRASFNPLLWIRRAFAVREQRTRLETLDDRLLRDIGVDRMIAKHEAERPFWDLPR